MKHLTVFLLLCLPIIGKGQFYQQSDNTISVQGVFITMETPEQIDFHLTIKYESPNFKSGSDSLLTITQEISNILEKNGIEKEIIRVSGISVNENYVYDYGERTKQGFIGSSRIEIQSILTQALTEKIFKSVGEFQYDVEYSVSFSLSEQQKEKLRKTTLEKAIQDAREKADIIAQSNNLRLVRINKVNFDDNMEFRPSHSEYDIVQEDFILTRTSPERPFLSELNLNPKEISIMKSIVIEWIIKKR
jgi:uncharacterized protein